MTALIVIGCIVLFFAVLLLSPVILIFSYKGGKVSAKLRYLLFVIDFSPEKVAKRAEKKAEKAVKKEYKKQEAEEEQPPLQKKKNAATDTAKTVWSYVKASKKGLDILRRHLVFYKIKAAIVVGGEDAAKTAQNYATYSILAANGLSVLDSLFVVKEPDISIRPDFLREQTLLALGLRVRILPLYPVLAGISILRGILKVMNKNKQKREKIKGGNKNERNERTKRTRQRKHAASCQ